jgi:dihydrofolate reductase
MRKLVASAFVSLDGVMQAPGGPEEDPTGGFKHGGWIPPHSDDATGAAISALFAEPIDLVLGRRTYDIFAAYWPYIRVDPAKSDFDALTVNIGDLFNRATKYVATHSPDTLTWQNSEWLGPDVVVRLRELKSGDGRILLVQGSSVLLQTLLAHDLLDEIRLLIYPIILGRGKRLFGDGTVPAGLRLTSSTTSPNGVLITRYARAGEVATGSFGADTPSTAEIERRKTMRGM